MRSASLGIGLGIFKQLGGGYKVCGLMTSALSTADIFSFEYWSRIKRGRHLIDSNYQLQMFEATAFGPSEGQHLLIRKIPILVLKRRNDFSMTCFYILAIFYSKKRRALVDNNSLF